MLRHWRLLAAFLPIVLFAQSERGSISGTVRDASGAVVPGARVSVTDPGTNTTLRTVTTETGDYTAPNLSAGTYTVRIEREGFKPAVMNNVMVNAGLAAHGDVTMEVGTAQQAVEVQQAQSSASKWSTAMTFGATVLGAFFGRKTLSAGNISRAATAARGVGRSMKESSDVTRAEENVGSLQQQQADLEAQLKSETDALETRLDPTTEQLETLALRPKKTDITIKTLALAWAPHWQSGDTDTPAWE